MKASIKRLIAAVTHGYLRERIRKLNWPYAQLFAFLQKLMNICVKDELFLIADKISPKELTDIKNRVSFYLSNCSHNKMIITAELPRRAIFSMKPALLFGDPHLIPRWIRGGRLGIFDIDYRRNPMDGWEWCKLTNFCSPRSLEREHVKERFYCCVKSLREQRLDRSYIFGTGPSLERAIEKDWSDGYRIVCNTIVRDPVLWNHLNPHFIAASDAIYHFGHTSFARAFRRDLAARLRETDTFFIYNAIFHEIAQRELKEFSDRLIPIPKGDFTKINIDLASVFALPHLGNILPSILLPLGCTLSKNINLWGFDGRAPNDELFWSNSRKHSYSELLSDLEAAHPAFFQHFVPEHHPELYTQQYLGDILDEEMRQAEMEGFKFVVLHKSWTPTLQKRVCSVGSSGCS